MSNDKLALEALDQIMEQAQVFASAWSLVGGPFDSGSALDDANDAKDELRTMVRLLAALAAEAEKQAGPVASDKEDAGMPCPYCADGHMVERRAMVCEGCKGTLVTKRQAGINIAARANR